MKINSIERYLNKVVCGDANEVMRKIPSNSVDLVITSPPYYKQRDYGKGGLGHEKKVEEYIAGLLEIFKECVRVIKDSGAIVFNIGDKYEDGNLLLVPYRFAIAVGIVIFLFFQKSLCCQIEFTFNKLLYSNNMILLYFIFVKSNKYFFDKDAFLGHMDYVRKKANGNGENVGKGYFNLIEASDLSADQKQQCRERLQEVIWEVKTGKIEGFRLKIKGIHAEPYGGQNGGRKIHLDRDGFTVIKI